jgi:hypothetical protein
MYGGAALEVAGLIVVVFQARRLYRRAFPERPTLARRVVRWVRRTLGRHKTVESRVSISAAGEVNVAGSLDVQTGSAPAEDLQTRVEQLEQAVTDLKRRHTEGQEKLSKRIAKLHEKLDEVLIEMRGMSDEQEEERRRDASESLLFQGIGAGAIGLGLVLSGWANLVC